MYVDYPLPVEIVPFSTIDVPGHIATIVFFDGCNLNCTFCHNYPLLQRKEWKGIEASNIIDKMVKNGFIDALSLSGGEPLMKPNLDNFIEYIKFLANREMGVNLYVNVDTNGIYTGSLERILRCVDKVTMDVKSSDKKFNEIGRPTIHVKSYLETIVESMKIVVKAGKDLSARLTYSPSMLDEHDLVEIGKTLASAGLFIPMSVQRFLKRNVREVAMGYVVPTNAELVKAGEILRGTGMNVEVSFR